jgi:3-dehydroquinate synthetase
MVRTLSIALGEQALPFQIGYQCTETFAAQLARMGFDRLIVVADSRAWSLYGGPLIEALDHLVPTKVLFAPSDERDKTLSVVAELGEQASANATVSSAIVTFGGGVALNVGGMLSAMLFRGLPLIHFPTTLVGMIDVAPSVRHAVNTIHLKSGIGLFHTPQAIFCDIAYLHTLSDDAIREGFVEAVKASLVANRARLDLILQAVHTYNTSGTCNFETFVTAAVESKLTAIGDDPKERATGLCLHYGHTLGHALEDLAQGTLSHGCAVAGGLHFAAELSRRSGLLTDEQYFLHRRIIQDIQLKIPPQRKNEYILRR